MSKERLSRIIDNIQENNYTWNLYFFRLDKRSNNPFFVYKVKFKNEKYLSDYAKNMLNATKKFQIEPIQCVQEYDGENTKVSCDKLSLTDSIIKEQWNKLISSVANATDKKFKEKIMGYILCATPQDTNIDKMKSVTFIKVANPIIEIKENKSVTYTAKPTSDELDILSDDIYRLYLTVDCIIYDENMYTFNHSFEKIFNIESSLKHKRENVISDIVGLEVFAKNDDFVNYAKSYKSHRTFVTISKERMDKIKTPNGRNYVSKRFNISLDTNGKFILENEKQASLLIKYLCYKIIGDEETNDLLEVGTVVKVEI